MSLIRLNSNQRMSQVVVHGDTVYLSGQVDPQATSTSVGEQTRAVLARIDALLAEAGTSKAHLISATIWLADIGTFNQMNEAWDAWVSPGQAPTRATVEARLAAPKFLVEIAAIAALP